MDPIDKEIVDDKLTQADLIRLMLHNAQHMATREEVKADILKLETNTNIRFDKVEEKIVKVDAKFDKIQWLILVTLFTVVFKDYIISLIANQ